MKVSEKVKDNAFKPIEVTLTIESEEELISLWHNFNIILSNSHYDKMYWNQNHYQKENYKFCDKFWNMINRKISELGLRKKITNE